MKNRVSFIFNCEVFMSMFKYIAFSLLLSVPMIGGATTTTVESLFGSSVPSLSSFDGPFGTGGEVRNIESGAFVDLWTLSVDPGESATIGFKSLDLPVGGVDIFKIDGFTWAPLGSYGLTNLSTGVYDFIVFGSAVGAAGGVYAGGVSAVPLPAAVWLFGSAMLGLLSLAKRKNQI
ncbi:MAG: hypothetical protein ACXWTL_08080 [Methylobacter sp.]